MSDARFEDGIERPVRLIAESAEDLTVISALLQDAVLESGDVSWMPKRRRVAILLNRFRWEDRSMAERRTRRAERVRSLLVVQSVLSVSASGVDPREKDVVLSLLSIDFTPGEDGAGRISLILAGDGEIALDVECIDISLTDVTRPYEAPSGRVPEHDLD